MRRIHFPRCDDMSNIKLGVTLYSFSTEYCQGKMTLEDCIRTAKELGAAGFEIVATQMIPLMGAIAERTKSKLGRFRPYILFGSPLLAVFSVLCFTHPFSGSSTAGVIYAAVIYIAAGMLYTLVNIPYGALAAVMTEDAEQRNQINASRNVGMNIGILIVNGLTANVMLYFSGFLIYNK